MNLTELTEEFQEATGRLDLEQAAITKYLNRGCKFLDELSLKVHKDSRYFGTLDVDTNYVALYKGQRTIKSVWAYAADEEILRVELEFIDFKTMRELYENQTADSAQPVYYTINPTRLANRGDQPIDLPAAWADYAPSDVDINDGILIYPPADKVYCIEVLGNFYTQELSEENPENWWSSRHSEIVIQAAIYRMDNNYRNTQGGKELLESISSTVQSIYYDELETEYNRPAVMRG